MLIPGPAVLLSPNTLSYRPLEVNSFGRFRATARAALTTYTRQLRCFWAILLRRTVAGCAVGPARTGAAGDPYTWVSPSSREG